MLQCLLSTIWVFFRLPEPKGRSYAELDVLFERRVSARKFAKTKIDVFAETLGDDDKTKRLSSDP